MNKRQTEQVKEAVGRILYMARRYADGRSTYAPHMFNDAYDTLRDILGKGESLELTTGDVEVSTWPYAQDGMYNPKQKSFAIGPRKYAEKT